MNYSFITSIENPTTRRLAISLLVICAVPILSAVLIAELVWKTMKAVLEIVRTQVRDTKPSISNLIEYIKEIW
jgi:hypothetical protein